MGSGGGGDRGHGQTNRSEHRDCGNGNRVDEGAHGIDGPRLVMTTVEGVFSILFSRTKKLPTNNSWSRMISRPEGSAPSLCFGGLAYLPLRSSRPSHRCL